MLWLFNAYMTSWGAAHFTFCKLKTRHKVRLEPNEFLALGAKIHEMIISVKFP